MTEHNPRAFIGANNPPPFDATEVERLDSEASGFLDAAAEWIEKGELSTESDAQLLNDFISGVKKRKTATDKARASAKKPHDDAGKAVQAAYKPIITKLEAVVSKVNPLLTEWLQKKEDARQAEIKRQLEEAQRQQEEAERKAAEAVARNDISGEIDAEAAMEDAARLEKAASRAAAKKANISSATGGGRTASLRTYYIAKTTNVRAAFMHFQDNPAVADLFRSLAEAEIRSKEFDPETMTIPGIEITAKQRAV